MEGLNIMTEEYRNIFNHILSEIKNFLHIQSLHKT